MLPHILLYHCIRLFILLYSLLIYIVYSVELDGAKPTPIYVHLCIFLKNKICLICLTTPPHNNCDFVVIYTSLYMF